MPQNVEPTHPESQVERGWHTGRSGCMTDLRFEGCERGHSPAEAPQDKPKPTVRVQADGHFSRRVELTLQLNGPAEGTGGGVTHLQDSRAQSSSGQATVAARPY